MLGVVCYNSRMIIYRGITVRALAKHESSITINQTINYEVDLDLRQLNAMAKKAAASKGKKSTDGPLSVRVVHLIEGPG